MSWTELKREKNKALMERYKDAIIYDYFSNGMKVAEIQLKYGLPKYNVGIIIKQHSESLKNNQQVIGITKPISRQGRPSKNSQMNNEIPAN
jgi:hypothetical protein